MEEEIRRKEDKSVREDQVAGELTQEIAVFNTRCVMIMSFSWESPPAWERHVAAAASVRMRKEKGGGERKRTR